MVWTKDSFSRTWLTEKTDIHRNIHSALQQKSPVKKVHSAGLATAMVACAQMCTPTLQAGSWSRWQPHIQTSTVVPRWWDSSLSQLRWHFTLGHLFFSLMQHRKYRVNEKNVWTFYKRWSKWSVCVCVCVGGGLLLWSVHRSQGSGADESRLCEKRHVGSDPMTIRWSEQQSKDAICTLCLREWA